MWVIRISYLVAIWCFLHPTFAQRRIKNGTEVSKDMPFAVYFIKAAPSERKYKGWTCGGSIVSPELIITSAACVEDVKHMYAIAGYNKFVEAEDINKDKCTKKMKKKVVFTCVPKAYDLEFTKIEKWAITDIAVVKVESPYDFEDRTYEKVCSYIPALIRVNYERKYQESGVECMALGWGHTDKWRSLDDYKSYNSETLRYVSTSILKKTECKKHFKTKDEMQENKELLKIIDKYMICTLHPGNIDEYGDIISQPKPELEGCITTTDQLCEEPDTKTEKPRKNSGATSRKVTATRKVTTTRKVATTRKVTKSTTTESYVPNSNDDSDDYINYDDLNNSDDKYVDEKDADDKDADDKDVDDKDVDDKDVDAIDADDKDANDKDVDDIDADDKDADNKDIDDIDADDKDADNKDVDDIHADDKDADNKDVDDIDADDKDADNKDVDNIDADDKDADLLRRKKSKNRRRSFSRRNGICQNDHGGPLVTWVGSHEVLIGVASVFKIVNGSKCAGPNLFTSTQCNGKFLDCILHGVLSGKKTRRSCGAPPEERGFYMIERRISWIGHPDGPAENEILETRPQVPLSHYNYG